MFASSQALSKAAATTRWAVGMCDNFVANMYGYSSSGYTTALSHWDSIPAGDKHSGSTAAPAGALMFWGGGKGHVAISDGSGGVFSTDMPSSGEVSHVSADKITTGWGKPYLGWSEPYFQGQTGTTGGVVNASDVSDITSKLDPLAWLAKSFGIDPKDLVERLALITLGAVLMILAVVRFTDTGRSVGKVVKGATTKGVV